MHHQQGKERVSHHQRKRSSSSGLVLPLPPQPLSRTSFSYSRQGPVSPPQAVVAVAVRRHKIIAPHSSLARAIVMGNDMSGEHGNVDMANSRDVNARHAASASGSSRARHTASTSSSSPSRDYQHPRPISNLTVLLNQHNIGDSVPVSGSPNRSRVRSSSSTSSRHVDEADSASGPAPAPTGTLGSSAPNIMFRLGSLLPPSQFARQHSASTRLHSERVRR